MGRCRLPRGPWCRGLSWLLFLLAAAAGNASLAQSTDATVVREFGLMVPMRDGVALATDVYRLDVGKKVPVIVVRTPYTRTLAHFFKEGNEWASRGYAYVIQDVRGRGDSGGEMNPLAQETFDGYDAQDWAAQQPWSNGDVLTMGGSYSGWTQAMPASLNHPAWRAMILAVTPPDPGRYWPARNGGVSIGMLEWAMAVHGRPDRSFEGSEDILWQAYSSLPLKEADGLIGQTSSVWQDYLANLHNEEYWQPRSYQHRIHQSRVPMLHVTGWYDGTLGGSLQNFEIMQRSADASSSEAQYLVIGPWRHWVSRDSQQTAIGEIDFGEASLMDIPALYDNWFQYHLGMKDNEVASWPRVRLFVMNGNRWLASDDWPVPGTRFDEFYLAGDGSRVGQGVLSNNRSITGPEFDQYDYDPSDATPFIWQHSVDSGGPDDYSAVDARSDVLVYDMPVAESAMTVCGPVTADLYASTSARDTDWVMRLSLVHPDGYVQRLTEGMLRARARGGDFENVPLTPGKVEHYQLDLWGTCVDVTEGYRLRATVMSAAFPLLARNLNTGGDLASETQGVVARQKIYHSERYPSSITLPVVPQS